MSNEKYYVPHGTYWPIIGSIGVSTLFVGFANQMHDVSWGWPVMVLGFAIIAFMFFPPGPISAPIFSGVIFATAIFGACKPTSSRGSAKASFIASKIVIRPMRAFSNTSFKKLDGSFFLK